MLFDPGRRTWIGGLPDYPPPPAGMQEIIEAQAVMTHPRAHSPDVVSRDRQPIVARSRRNLPCKN
jgi:hypothetical protein